MNINIDAFLQTLPIMFSGMLGIFTVIVIIYISILLLLKFFPDKSSKEKDKKNN